MSEWEDQSLRDFVSSLGDTAVDLEPIGQKTREEQEQEEAEEAAKAKKKRIILISGMEPGQSISKQASKQTRGIRWQSTQ